MSDGKYKILRSLNTSGTVTLAENNDNGARFVLKELTEESLPIYRRISEFPPQENLMQVHEIIRQDGKITAVCELAEGKPLDELLDSGRVFPISEIRHITVQLCRAAEQLHHNGIIHRDITPKNIIIDEKLHLTLIDYGISRLFTGNREQDTTLYGTEGFAPPEQYGFRETRFTADIYAIGVVMKLLLNVCPNCPPTQEVLLRKIAAKCTRFVPEERFKSAAAVRRAVTRSQRIIPVGITAVSSAVTAGILAAVLIFMNVNSAPPPTSKVQQLPITSAETSASTTAQTITPAVETSASTTAQTITTTVETSASSTAQTITPAVETTATTTATTARTTASTTTQTAATTARTTASTTAKTAATTVTEAAQTQELHTSDMDNPNKITVITQMNERGYYEDFFEYQFYDDPMVHGKWHRLTSIPIDSLTPLLTASSIKNNYFIGNGIFSDLSFGENGEADVYFQDGTKIPCETRWTNGYLICDYVEGTAAQRLFVATIDGEEFLFAAIKVGDFSRGNKVYFYEVYTRKE